MIAIVHQFGDVDVTGQSVSRGCDDYVSVAIAALLVIEGRQTAFQVDVTQVVVDKSLQGDGFGDGEGNLSELL